MELAEQEGMIFFGIARIRPLYARLAMGSSNSIDMRIAIKLHATDSSLIFPSFAYEVGS